MSATTSHGRVLPKDLMETQLGQVDLLLAMYASDGAATISDELAALVERLRAWCECDEEDPPAFAEHAVTVLLAVSASDETDSRDKLYLEINVPLQWEHVDSVTGYDAAEPPKVRVRIQQQPAWMSKAEATQLNDEIPDEDMLTIIEHVKDAASQCLAASRIAADNSATKSTSSSSSATNQPLVRAWFYFPSISTRSKRDDLINYAPSYGLTGFLLAGKPGVLCLEGGAQAIDGFMKFIKTESWGDIPPQHKKVSERYRERGLGGGSVARAFADMREITDLVGERRGERANRNDMKALESWLNDNGVGEAFAKVLI
jgi:hypothetical protein